MPGATPRMSVFRSAARYLTEPHPFARNPVTQRPHSVPWGVYAKHVGRAGAAFVPFYVVILGWPLGVAEIIKRTGGV